MINEFFITVGKFLENGTWIWLVVISVFLAFYLFWRGVKAKCSNESFALEYHLTSSYNRSLRVFDFLFIVLISTLFIARLMLIFSGVDLFVDSRWFWLPYEKIQDQVYIMNSFPWLFLNFSVGGFLVEGVLLGLISSFGIYSWLLNLKLKDFIEPISIMVRSLIISFLVIMFLLSRDQILLYFISGVVVWLILDLIFRHIKLLNRRLQVIDLLKIIISFLLLIAGPYVFRLVWGYEGVNREFVDSVWILGSILALILLIKIIYQEVKIISNQPFGKIRSRFYKK